MNATGVKGVFYCNSKKYWISSISIDGQMVRLVSTKDKFEAICVRKSAEAKKKSGEEVFTVTLTKRREMQTAHTFKTTGSIKLTSDLVGVNIQQVYRILRKNGYKFRA